MQKLGKQRQYQLNKEIEALLDERGDNPNAYSAKDKEMIARYSGYGGLGSSGGNGDSKDVLYEYYTPVELVKVMWQLLLKHGFTGGQVLEPSAGIGRFLAFAPDTPNPIGFTAIEISKVSSRIAKILHPQAQVLNKHFEQLFLRNRASIKDNVEPRYDAVIGNPPYGSIKGGQGGRYLEMGERAYTGATRYDEYFILRGIDLLKSGGVLCYVTGTATGVTFLKGNNTKAKDKIAERAELVDAFMLPEGIFPYTQISCEILVFKKF